MQSLVGPVAIGAAIGIASIAWAGAGGGQSPATETEQKETHDLGHSGQPLASSLGPSGAATAAMAAALAPDARGGPARSEVELDLDELRGQRRSLRAACDVCVVVALLAAAVAVLSQDYKVDVLGAARAALPREAELVSRLVDGARKVRAALSSLWEGEL
jgi:hypothetical protein